MELLKGGDLSEFIRKYGPLPEETTAKLLVPILQSVACIHTRGVAHRDIKPANFVFASPPKLGPNKELLEEVELKVVDFGTCVECLKKKQVKFVAGTALYLAPEVCVGVLERKSDVWAVGLIMYEMLSGRFPFWDTYDEAVRSDRDEIMHKITMEIVDYSRHAEVRDVSSEARDLLSKLLHDMPRRRIAAADALGHPWIQTHVPGAEDPAMMDPAAVTCPIDGYESWSLRAECIDGLCAIACPLDANE